jgi:LAO/AO transport system kinase
VVVVVTAPGLGDEVQALKAGILEIADVLVVNKADRDGAGRAVKDLTSMLEVAHRAGAGRAPVEAGVPVLETVATAGTGVVDLVEVIDRVRALVPERRAARRRRQVAAQLLAIAGQQAQAEAARLLGSAEAPGPLAPLLEEVVARRRDPTSAARALLAAITALAPPGR